MKTGNRKNLLKILPNDIIIIQKKPFYSLIERVGQNFQHFKFNNSDSQYNKVLKMKDQEIKFQEFSIKEYIFYN